MRNNSACLCTYIPGGLNHLKSELLNEIMLTCSPLCAVADL